MNKAKLCLCFVLVVLTVNLIECKGGHGGHGGGHSSHGGHSSGGHSSGGHSTGGHSTGGHSSGGGGWSFFGWGKGSSSSSSSSHTYPKSPSYSGHGTGGSHSYPPSPRLSGSTHYGPSRPTYYTAPQYVYVTRYREAPSPYSDLLTGLTMYNLGRSHHYHHHYYNDDYHRSSSSAVYSPVNHGSGTNASDEAKCVLKIKKDWKLEVLKIPCAIVSTFDNGNRTSNEEVTNTPGNNCSSLMNMNINSTFVNGTNLNNAPLGSNTTSNDTAFNPCVNQTVLDIAEPLSVTGAPIAPSDASGMECSVEITTKREVIQHNIECSDLLKYAKMAVPEDKVTNVLPAREKLKSILDKPPWWLSLFIAV